MQIGTPEAGNLLKELGASVRALESTQAGSKRATTLALSKVQDALQFVVERQGASGSPVDGPDSAGRGSGVPRHPLVERVSQRRPGTASKPLATVFGRQISE